ncbi:MAG: hypothetical protein C4560_09420 [Nitrospiraceae bacterium]|nr:MAG: hypothetical protein C4560_09420 [Nitrospiraceae bacterium]
MNKIIFIYLLLFPLLVFASDKCEYVEYVKYIADYLGHLEKNKTAVFYSEYEYRDSDKSKDIMVGLIIGLGKTNGLLIEKYECVVGNPSSISYSDKESDLVLEETHGGIYSYDRAEKLLANFKGKKFVLLKPAELRRELEK